MKFLLALRDFLSFLLQDATFFYFYFDWFCFGGLGVEDLHCLGPRAFRGTSKMLVSRHWGRGGP